MLPKGLLTDIQWISNLVSSGNGVCGASSFHNIKKKPLHLQRLIIYYLLSSDHANNKPRVSLHIIMACILLQI